MARGIESDISNLMGLLKVAKVLPEGLFIDTVVQHLKVEMAQECDYQREAECCRRMKASFIFCGKYSAMWVIAVIEHTFVDMDTTWF